MNLHAQCHELVHFDVPWSLIRIEQRNGRIDRYGQRTSPQITALLLDLSEVEGFDGDIYVLRRLLEREQEAHEQLGDAASLMQKYDAASEEKALIDVLRYAKDIDDVLPEVADVDPVNDFLEGPARGGPRTSPTPRGPPRHARRVLRPPDCSGSDADFLLSGLTELHTEPGRPVTGGGVDLVVDDSAGLIQFTPNRGPLPPPRSPCRSLTSTTAASRRLSSLTSRRDVAELQPTRRAGRRLRNQLAGRPLPGSSAPGARLDERSRPRRRLERDGLRHPRRGGPALGDLPGHAHHGEGTDRLRDRARHRG